jgi:hypothetical protein
VARCAKCVAVTSSREGCWQVWEGCRMRHTRLSQGVSGVQQCWGCNVMTVSSFTGMGVAG